MRRTCWFLILLGFSVGASACFGDPEVAKRRFLESGDRYAAEKKLAEAAIQYRNVLALDARHGEARYKLAAVLEASDQTRAALREYVVAADLLPENLEVQIRAGQALLKAGRYPEAKARAEAVLKRDPKTVDALALLGNALATLKDLDGAVAQLEEAIELDPTRPLSYANLGVVQMAQGDHRAAEATFKKAVEAQPDSAAAHAALANYYWAAGRHGEAEAEFQAALALQPTSAGILRGLAAFYVLTNRQAQAEQYLETYVDTAGDVASKLMLADYYVGIGRAAEASALLEAVALDPTGFVDATNRLAALNYASGNASGAHQAADRVLERQPDNETALVLKARLLLDEGRPADALGLANRVTERNPKSVLGLYVKGSAQAAAGSSTAASETLNAVLALRPSFLSARLKLAELYLARGNAAAAADFAVSVLQQEPRSTAGHLLLAKAALLQRDLGRAESELGLLGKAYPEAAEIHYLTGNLHWLKRDPARARQSYTRALELEENAIPALAGLIEIDLAEKKLDAARQRLMARLEPGPSDPSLLLLAGRTFATIGDEAEAEAALRKAIEVDPALFEGYFRLAQFYRLQNRLEEARQQFEEAARRQPEAAVTMHTMVGTILVLQGRNAEARKSFEQALELNPNAAVAANNLAWDYLENGGNLDLALQLAQTAKAHLPNDGPVSDTLGWAYYKKGLISLAVPALQQAAEQEPGSSTIQYHLGLALLKNDETAAARRALQRALRLNAKFPGASEAKRVLTTIKG